MTTLIYENFLNSQTNSRFYGFCVELLEKISHEVGFNYILNLVSDGKYGAKDQTSGEWNGMVGQIMKHVGNNFPLLKSSNFENW